MTLLEFEAPSDPTQVHPNVLLYGPPKTGKTGGAGSAPGRIVMLNADQRNASLIAHRRAGSRLREISLKKGEILKTMFAVTQLAWSADPPDVVVVDTVGELHRRLLEEQSKENMRPTLNQYGDTSKYIERFARSLCEAPVTFVLVGHEFPVHNADGSVDKLMWCGTKSSSESMSQTLMGMVDIVGYTAVIETEKHGRVYAAQLITNEGRRGGDRFGVLGSWQPLDLTKWLELIRAQRENDNEQALREAPKEVAA
jgi:hypothetical protein